MTLAPAHGPGPETGPTAADQRADLRTMMLTVSVLGLGVALAAAGQALVGVNRGVVLIVEWGIVLQLAMNLVLIGVSLALLWWLRIEQRRPRVAVGLVIVVGAILTIVRTFFQLALGEQEREYIPLALAGGAIGGLLGALIIGFAVLITRAQQRTRAAERAALLPAALSSALLVELLRKRMRARHAMATSVRERLVPELDRLSAEIADTTEDLDGLPRLRVLDLKREFDNLAVASQKMLTVIAYPEALEHGLIPGIRAFVTSMPNPIVVRLHVGDADAVLAATGTEIRHLDLRAVLLHIVVEAILDAVEFGHARQIDVSVHLHDGVVQVVVEDDGQRRTPKDWPIGLDKLHDELKMLGGSVLLEIPPGRGHRVVAIAPPVPTA